MCGGKTSFSVSQSPKAKGYLKKKNSLKFTKPEIKFSVQLIDDAHYIQECR